MIYHSRLYQLWSISPSFPGVSSTLGQINHVLLSSMPRSYTSRLAWLSQTLIAMASGRINQNYYYFIILMRSSRISDKLDDLSLTHTYFMNNDSYHKQKDVHKILVRLCTCLESAVISMNVRIATIPTSEQTITQISNPADSRRVLH